MTWDQFDNAYNTAKEHGLKFKWHTFTWGQQQPSWLGSLSAEEQKQQVEEWIAAVAERYPDVDFIDVVNEPLHETPVYANALGGKGTTGWDWVIWAFEKARATFPNAKLILNDYNVINDNNATNKYITIINLLKERQLIDYIGEQGHNLETTSNLTITSNLDKLAATGLPILISEYDLNFSSDSEQRAKYESQFPALWGHSGVHGVTLWGYRQGEIWRTDAYLVRSNGTARPALEWLTTYVKANFGGTFCLTTEVQDKNDHAGLNIYPNPSNGEVTVVSSFEFLVRELHGRLITRGTGSATIQLSPGFYLVQTSSETKKLIIR